METLSTLKVLLTTYSDSGLNVDQTERALITPEQGSSNRAKTYSELS